MCLAVPMQVLELKENTAVVDMGGTRKAVRLDVIDRTPTVGDYVIVHAGFAIHCIDEEEAKITLQYFEEIFADETSR
ncbi:MAG: HypC/HybG/HupF family hydrogenase formation chaperone [Desulfovibrionales bacterium]|nr:HypC/HybG/HupF family hydrogenase formation chaperone [Desulfovibrionales bacterium]